MIDRITALHTALIEKLGHQPYIQPSLYVTNRYCVSWYETTIDRSTDFHGDTLEDVFLAAEAHVENMPTPEERQLQLFQRNLAKLIEDAPLSVDAAPLRDFQLAMTENLLCHTPQS